MAYKLVETALAQADLDAILSYLALSLENPTAATAFANEVEKCYTALEQMPLSLRAVPRPSAFFQGLP